MQFSVANVQDESYAIERSSGKFYRIDVEPNGRKLRLVCLSEVSSLGGKYELLSKS